MSLKQYNRILELPLIGTKSSSYDRSTLSKLDKTEKSESAMNLSLDSIGKSESHDSTVVLCEEYEVEESLVYDRFD